MTFSMVKIIPQSTIVFLTFSNAEIESLTYEKGQKSFWKSGRMATNSHLWHLGALHSWAWRWWVRVRCRGIVSPGSGKAWGQRGRHAWAAQGQWVLCVPAKGPAAAWWESALRSEERSTQASISLQFTSQVIYWMLIFLGGKLSHRVWWELIGIKHWKVIKELNSAIQT